MDFFFEEVRGRGVGWLNGDIIINLSVWCASED